MKIWLIKTGEETQHDKNSRLARTGQLFEELSKKYDITWFNSSFNHQKKKQRFIKTTSINYKFNSKIIYLYGSQYQANISFHRYLSQILNVIEFVKELKKNSDKPDIIISSYPPVELAFIACLFAKKNNIPFIIDVRDMWPDIILTNLSFLKKIFFFPLYYLWNFMLKYTLRNSHSILSITKEFLDWTLKKGGILFDLNKHQFFHLSKPINNNITKKNINSKVLKKISVLPGKINIVFAGSISKRHNFKIIFNSLKEKKFNNINIIVCGAGKLFESYKTEYSEYKNIIFFHWLNDADLNYVLANCHYGLLPYYGFDFNKSYPNKIAEYLSNNLKIISCDEGIVSDLIKNNNIGFKYKQDSVPSFHFVLKKLSNKKDNRPRKVYEKIFNFKTILNNHVKHIENIYKVNRNK